MNKPPDWVSPGFNFGASISAPAENGNEVQRLNFLVGKRGRGRPKGGARLAEAKALIAQGKAQSRAELIKSGLSGSTIDRARRDQKIRGE